jgi:hypothetical protein
VCMMRGQDVQLCLVLLARLHCSKTVHCLSGGHLGSDWCCSKLIQYTPVQHSMPSDLIISSHAL